MTIDEQIYAFLTADPDVAALVATRVYPVLIPQEAALPAVAYRRVDTPRTYSHDGYSGLARPRFQLDCVGESYASATAVATALRRAFERWHAAYGGSAMVQNQVDVPWLEQTGHYQVSVDVIIWHNE